MSYYLINFLSQGRKSKAKPLSLEKTKRILKEIKYQALTTCVSFTDAIKASARKVAPSEDD